jgi:hypothetical protein
MPGKLHSRHPAALIRVEQRFLLFPRRPHPARFVHFQDFRRFVHRCQNEIYDGYESARQWCYTGRLRLNFVKLKSWKISAKGNSWIEYQGHHIIVVRRSNGKFTLRIDGEAGKLFFPDRNSAMARAFDVVMRKVDLGR